MLFHSLVTTLVHVRTVHVYVYTQLCTVPVLVPGRAVWGRGRGGGSGRESGSPAGRGEPGLADLAGSSPQPSAEEP